MKRMDRDVAMFSLSALDVLAMSTGVFLLLIVLLMPYYRNHFDRQSELEGLTREAAEQAAQADGIQPRIEAEARQASALLAELQSIRTQTDALTGATPEPRPTPTSEGGQPTIQELDLVFVVDTTASMGPVIRDMARSLAGLARILERLVPSVRIGVVAYRDADTGMPPVTSLSLTPTRSALGSVVGFIEVMARTTAPSQTVQEDLHLGVATALALPFRPEAMQSVVVIGDAAAHDFAQAETLARIRAFVAQSDRRTVSALFVTTPTSLYYGNIDRRFFERIAQAGRGELNDQTGSMTESLLLSILVE